MSPEGNGFSWAKHGHLFDHPTRCNRCSSCKRFVRANFMAKIMGRIEHVGIKKVYLWTFGTRFKGEFWYFLM